MAEATLAAQVREEKGKQAAKHIRQMGLVPGIIYGPGETPSMLNLNGKELLTLLHSFGRNAIVNLRIGDKKKNIKAFIYDIQHDPISGDIIHVDLKRINLNEKIHLSVPIRLSGVPEGVKNEGGILEHTLHSLEIFCLPTNIPDTIVLDVSNLHLGYSIHVKDIPASNFEILTELSATVVHVVAPKVVKVEEEVEAAVEGVEPAEPEVVGEEKEE